MAKTYRPYVPEQDLLLPPNLRDWLADDHLAYFVSDLIDQLDLSAITARYEDEERGQPPYHPVMMTKVLVYAYCVGVFASRKIERRLQEDVAFRVLAAGNQPDFRTISDFRKQHLPALGGLFEQVLRLALEAGAMTLGRVALDSTKVKANASKHKAMSYGRMRDKAQQLQAEVKYLLSQAEAADAEDDRRLGPSRRGADLPAELQRRESRLRRIREAKRALEARARDEAAAAGEPTTAAKPPDTAQYNFTDPESRIMHHKPDGFVQGYNVQVAVEGTLQLIVGEAVTQDTNDKHQLRPMIRTIHQQARQAPANCWRTVATVPTRVCGIWPTCRSTATSPRGRLKHSERPAPAPRGRIPRDATARRADGAQAAHASRRGDLRHAQRHRGTGAGADQTGPRLSAVSPARPREGPRRMGARLRDAQRLEALSDLLRLTQAVPPAPPL